LTASGLEFFAASPISVFVAETEFMKMIGRQPSLYASATAWMANVGVAATKSVFAPEAFSFAICDATSDDVTS
jgi:hypothetical protein